MGFYLRKSVKVGPMRFNFSKSGIGVSGGVKGFRVGSGPRGNYVHMGRGGIYYRKTLPSGRGRGGGGGGAGRAGNNPQPFQQLPDGTPIPDVPMTEIESGDVSGMAHSSSAELLAELNEKQRMMRWGPVVLTLALIMVAGLAILGTDPVLTVVVAGVLAVLVFTAFRQDVIRKTVVLFYDFDNEMEGAYGKLHDAASALAACAKKWHIAASGEVADRKYHAGASSVVDRADTSIRREAPKFLKSNIETIAIDVGRQTLHFFPDRILLFDKGRVGAVGYDELNLQLDQTRFVEDARPPRDAQVIDYTWQYVNKKGGPDRRFANNRQLPVCLYDEMHFSSASGLNEVIQVSRAGAGVDMAHSLAELIDVCDRARNGGPATPSAVPNQGASPYMGKKGSPWKAVLVGLTIAIAAVVVFTIAAMVAISDSDQTVPQETNLTESSEMERGPNKGKPETFDASVLPVTSPPDKVTVEPTAAATAPEAPPIQIEQKTAPIPLPTSVRKWTSGDGRTLLAKVTEIDLEKQTLKFVRADGKEFLDYPISNLIAEDRAYLTGEPAPLPESVGKDFGIGGEYDVAQQVNLRSTPSLSSGLIVNEKATRMLEGVHYLSIDNSTTVKVLELANEWARIQVTEPQFLSASHRGWVPVTSLVSGQHSEKLDGWIRNDCMVYETKGKVNAIGRLTSPSAVGAADDGSGWLRLIHGPVKEISGEGYVEAEILDKGAYFERESLSTVPPGKW